MLDGAWKWKMPWGNLVIYIPNLYAYLGPLVIPHHQEGLVLHFVLLLAGHWCCPCPLVILVHLQNRTYATIHSKYNSLKSTHLCLWDLHGDINLNCVGYILHFRSVFIWHLKDISIRILKTSGFTWKTIKMKHGCSQETITCIVTSWDKLHQHHIIGNLHCNVTKHILSCWWNLCIIWTPYIRPNISNKKEKPTSRNSNHLLTKKANQSFIHPFCLSP